jgi:D-xylose transport system substrate-binding protein
VYLRAGQTPPTALVNGTTTDPSNSRAVPSVLLKATWVTPKLIQSTVIANGVINPVSLCTNVRPSVAGDHKIPTFKQDCKTYKSS